MKRPPRLVWLIIRKDKTWFSESFPTRKRARAFLENLAGDWEVVGPYVLAERVRQK